MLVGRDNTTKLIETFQQTGPGPEAAGSGLGAGSGELSEVEMNADA
jgi:hypothetical protein